MGVLEIWRRGELGAILIFHFLAFHLPSFLFFPFFSFLFCFVYPVLIHEIPNLTLRGLFLSPWKFHCLSSERMFDVPVSEGGY